MKQQGDRSVRPQRAHCVFVLHTFPDGYGMPCSCGAFTSRDNLEAYNRAH